MYEYSQPVPSLLPSCCSRPSSSARRKSAKSATRVRRMPSGTLGPDGMAGFLGGDDSAGHFLIEHIG